MSLLGAKFCYGHGIGCHRASDRISFSFFLKQVFMAVRTTQQGARPQQVEHDESLFKNKKDRMQMQRNALTTKVCLKYMYVYGAYYKSVNVRTPYAT